LNNLAPAKNPPDCVQYDCPNACSLTHKRISPRIGRIATLAEKRETFTRLPWLPNEGHREGVQMSDFQGVNPVRWPVWLALPKVELWQAVALTLEIEPTDDLRRTDLIHGPHGGMSLRRLRGDFWGRLSVCKQGMGAEGPIRPQGPLYAGIIQDSRCPVLLSEVVEFLSKAAFDIPDELQITNASTTPGAPAASLDEAIAAAVAEHKAKKEWFAAAVAECEARDAKLSALSPDVANMARKLMGLPPRSNAPKPLTPVRAVSAPMATPPRTPAEAVPRPAALLAEPVRFEDLPRVMAEAMHADPMARAGARINLGAELAEMVASGRLKVRDSLTHGPHTYPVGDALRNAVLLPQEVRQLLAERGVSAPAVPVPAPIPASSAPAVAVPEPVAAPAEPVPDADRLPTVQQAIAPYVAKLMQERPNYTAEKLHLRMRRDAGGDDSPFSRLAHGMELFCVDAGNTCSLATVRAVLTAYRKTLRKRRGSTVEVPSNP
jgi:hypothetical protein